MYTDTTSREESNHSQFIDCPAGEFVPVTVGRKSRAVLGYKPARAKPSLATLRLASIHRLIEARHGGPVDTDGDGEFYFEAALSCLHARDIAPLAWARLWVPKLVADEGPEWIAKQKARGLTSTDIGRLLRVTTDEVRRLRLTTIRSFDRTERERTADRKRKDREAHMLKRRKAGAMPRERYQAESITAKAPWKAEGVSRRTWYRRQQEKGLVGTGASATENLRFSIEEYADPLVPDVPAHNDNQATMMVEAAGRPTPRMRVYPDLLTTRRVARAVEAIV